MIDNRPFRRIVSLTIVSLLTGLAAADWFKLTPSQGYIGTEVQFTGHSDTVRTQTVSLLWPSLIPGNLPGVIAGAFANASGDFSGKFSVPYRYVNGSYTVTLRAGYWDLGSTSFTVGPPQGGFEPPPPGVPAPLTDWALYQEGTTCRRISMLSSTEGWAVGGGEVWYFNGTAWLHHSDLDEGEQGDCIFMLSPTDGWIGTRSGQLWHWDGQAWTLHTTLPSILQGPMAIHGIAPGDLWTMVYANEGWSDIRITLYHYNGTAWSKSQVFGETYLTGGDVKMTAANDGWAMYTVYLGSDAKTAFYRFNGSTWTLQSELAACLFQMAAVSASDIWAAGIYKNFSRHTFSTAHWNGSQWAVTDTMQPVTVNPDVGNLTWARCGFADADHGWAATSVAPATLAKYDHGTWSYQSLSDTVSAIEFAGPDDGWMFGGKGAYRLYGDSHLQLIPNTGPPGQQVTARVSGLTPSTNFWITWEKPPDLLGGQMVTPVRSNAGGGFETTLFIPADAAPGGHQFVLSAQQYVAGQGLVYAPVTSGNFIVKDGCVYAIAVPSPVYVRLGGWPAREDRSASTTVRARVSTLLPPAPATNLAMTAKVQSAPAGGCTVTPGSGKTDGNGYFTFQATPSQGENRVALYPTASPLDTRVVRVVGYIQPPPPANMPAGFTAQAWTGTGALREITLDPIWGPQGTEFTISGKGFTPTQFAYAYWDGTDLLGQAHTQSGTFSLDAVSKSASGAHTVVVVTHSGDYAVATFFSQTTAPDLEPPKVTIEYPPNGATVSGPVTLQASATDASGVASMDLQVGPNLLAHGPGGSISTTWDTTLTPGGSYTVTAYATDTKGNRGSAMITVNVDNSGGDHLQPNVTIGTPANGAQVQGTVNVTATATDNVGVTSMAIFLDGAILLGSHAGTPCAASFDANRYANGAHTLDVMAWDAARNSGTKTISITIKASTHNADAPVITVNSPADWQSCSGTITVSAQAVNSSGTGTPPRLAAWLAGQRIADSASGQVNQSLDTTQFSSTLYNLTFSAVDSEGHTATRAVPISICNAASSGKRRDEPPPPQCHAPIGQEDLEAVILAPEDGSRLLTNCFFTAQVGGIARILPVTIVEVFLENLTTHVIELHTLLEGSPRKSVIWPLGITPKAVGTYRLTARAGDAEGNIDEATATFYVNDPTGSGCSPKSLMVTVQEYYQNANSHRIQVAPFGDTSHEIAEINLERVNIISGERKLLATGAGTGLDYLWNIATEEDGYYQLFATASTTGTSVQPGFATVEIDNDTGTLASIALKGWPQQVVPQGGYAHFPLAIETFNEDRLTNYYAGPVVLNSSEATDRIDIDGAGMLPLPQTVQMNKSDKGKKSFELVADATITAKRVVTAAAGGFSGAEDLFVVPFTSESTNSAYRVDLNIAITNILIFVAGSVFKPDGSVVAYDLCCELRKPSGATGRDCRTGLLSWIDYQWEFQHEEGQNQMRVLLTEHFSGETIVDKSFPVEVGDHLIDSVFSDEWGIAAGGPLLKGVFSGLDEPRATGTGLHWDARMLFANPASGLPGGVAGARIDWSAGYPDGTTHTGSAQTGDDGAFSFDDELPAGLSAGVLQLEVRASREGFKPLVQSFPIAIFPLSGGKGTTQPLLFGANAPALLLGPGDKMLGRAGGAVVLEYPGGTFFDLATRSGTAPVANGEHLRLVAGFSGMDDSPADPLKMSLQLGDERQTVLVRYPERKKYVLDFTVNLSGKGSKLDLPSPAVALYLTAAVPAKSASNVAPAAPVTLTFSRAVNPAAFVYDCTPNPGGWVVSWNPDKTVATLSHTAFGSNIDYIFRVTGVVAPDGQSLVPGDIPAEWGFTTRGGCTGDQLDYDDDGYNSFTCGGGDCDDNDPAVHPGATEVRNGLDDDCDGLVDEGTDGVPPAAVADLSGSYDSGTGNLTLAWTATGDDGYVGTAHHYEVRYHPQALTEDYWALSTPVGGAPAPKAPGGAEQWAVKVTLAAGDYQVGLKVVDESGNASELSGVVPFSVAGPPAAPSNLKADPISNTRIDLTWTDNSGTETAFKIERKTGAGAYAQIATVGPNVAAYSNTGLTAGASYCYRVRAAGSSGDSAWSNEACAVAMAKPAAPSTLRATVKSVSRIDIAWNDNSSNEAGFKIERKAGAGSYSQIATVGANVVTYSNTGLAAGTTYTYRVRSTNAAADSAYTNEAAVSTAVPAAPSGLQASAVSTSRIDLAWTDNSNSETGFKIERKTDPGGSYAQIATAGAGVTAFSNTGLALGTTYRYRVRAVNAVGNSMYSNEAVALTPGSPPAAPSNLQAAAVSASAVSLLWQDNASNESGFKIERKTGTGSYAQIASVGASVSACSDTGLSADTAYTYRVRAWNAAGHSVYTSESSATPATGFAIAAAVDDALLAWSTGGNAKWAAQSAVSYYGGSAARSGAVAHGQSSWAQARATGPGTVQFYWKVSSEAGADYLTFFLDGVEQAKIGGEVNWQQRTVALAWGGHTLKWEYKKSAAGSAGQDAGFLDRVQFTASPYSIGGFLGVGTMSPQRAIHVQGTNAVFRMDRPSDTAAFMIARTSGTAQVLKTFVVGVNASAPNHGAFVINDLGQATSGSGVNRLTIDSEGRALFGGTVRATAFVQPTVLASLADIQPLILAGDGIPSAGDTTAAEPADEAAGAARLVEQIKAHEARIESLRARCVRLQEMLRELRERKMDRASRNSKLKGEQ